MRIITASILILIISAFLVSGCRPAANPHRSSLLDSAQVTFLGDAEQDSYLGNATVWNDDLVLIGTKKERDKDAVRSDFIWLVDMDGKLVWEKMISDLRLMDVAAIDSNSVFVLLNHPKEAQASEFVLWKMNHSGDLVSEIKFPLLAESFARYIERVEPNHFIVLTWKKSEADTTSYTVENIHVDAQGNRLSTHWDLSATVLFPLRNGDFLGIKDNTDRLRTYTTQIQRIQRDGKLLWTADKVTDPLNSMIYGVTETGNGDLLLSAFSDGAHAPVLAKFSAAGERLWVKSPPEMQGCRIYSLTSWKNNQYIIAADKKTLRKGSFSTAMWDALVAFVIDEKGTVIDYDIIPQYWTLTVGGTVSAGANDVYFLGVGGKEPRDFLKKTQVAIYKLTR